MAPSRWFKRVPDPITQAQAALHGWDSPFTADSVVRYYQGRTLADWKRDTGDTVDEVTIVAGIGTLVLDALGTRYTQARASMAPWPVSEDVIVQRSTVCRACSRYRAGSDQCTLCGCAFVVAERIRSPVAHCPEGRWL
jgi:hypothetical protein